MIVEKMDFIEKYNKKEWEDCGGYDEYRQQADVDYNGEYELTDDNLAACKKMVLDFVGVTPWWLFRLVSRVGVDNEKVEEGLSALGVKIVYIPNKVLDFYDESVVSIDPADVDDWTRIDGGELVIVEKDNYEYIKMRNDECNNRQDKPYTHYIEAKKDAFLNSTSYSDFKDKLSQIDEPSYY